MKKLILFVCMAFVVCACSKKNGAGGFLCSCPHATICFQPYGSFTEQEVKRFLPALQKNMEKYLGGGEWSFEIRKPVPLPIKPVVGRKHKALDFLDIQQEEQTDDNQVIIGLTHEDLCHDIHGVKNYGIIGLSYSGEGVAIVSDKRLKNKSAIWKTVIHEFCHAFFSANHCPNDDPTCMMADAHKHKNFAIQNRLCDSCAFN